MNKRIEEYRGGVAWVMSGLGPKPTLAPPDDNGSGGANGDGNGDKGNGDGQGDGNGSSDDKRGDGDGTGKDGGDGPGDGRKSKLDGKGMFAHRSDGSNGSDGGDGGKEAPDDGRPKGLADKFWNTKEKTVNVDALVKSYQDLEKSHGELKRSKNGGGEVPENAEDYFKEGLKLPDEVKNLTLETDDPGLKAAAEVFKEEGIPKEVAHRIVTKMFARMDEHAPPPLNPEEELKALGKGGKALVDGLFVWADGLTEAGHFSDDDVDVIEVMMATAKGARLLNKFRSMTGEKPIPIDPGTGQAAMSPAEWSEAYREAVKNKDYKEQARLDKIGEGINQ